MLDHPFCAGGLPQKAQMMFHSSRAPQITLNYCWGNQSLYCFYLYPGASPLTFWDDDPLTQDTI